jgi:hypothetical protein
MAIVLGKPGVDGLSEAVGVLREWQYEGAPMQLPVGKANIEAVMDSLVQDLLSAPDAARLTRSEAAAPGASGQLGVRSVSVCDECGVLRTRDDQVALSGTSHRDRMHPTVVAGEGSADWGSGHGVPDADRAVA